MPLMKRTIWFFALALVSSSCGIPKGQQSDNLTSIGEDQVYRAQYSDPETSLDVSYEANEKQAGIVDLAVNVNSKSFRYELSKEQGLKSFTPGSNSLTEDEKLALSNMLSYMADADLVSYPNDKIILSAYTGLDYLANTPQGHQFSAKRFDASLGLRNEGVSCLKRGVVKEAKWRDAKGIVHRENVVVGSNRPGGYGCMGRCGADCGWGAPSSWTKDCLDHDACSDFHNASGGGSDPNCGESFNQAMDDWFWGVFAGCSG